MLTTVLDVAGLVCLIAFATFLFGIAGLLGALGASFLLLSWVLTPRQPEKLPQVEGF